MDTISKEHLFSTIAGVVEMENSYLEENFKQGIFFMPELAFAYMCGKAIMANRTEIFGSNEYEWVREKKYGNNYGIADLVFEPPKNGGPEIVIEFKMDNTHFVYHDDVKKLRGLEGNYLRLFCGLKLVFSHQVEGFLKTLEEKFDAKWFDFRTIDTKIKGSDHKNKCLLSLWEIE